MEKFDKQLKVNDMYKNENEIILTPGCARFAEISSELTKTWSSGAT